MVYKMATKAQQLRKLMKQQKNEKKKISHPLAKYNNLDQLVCIICSAVIKNEVVWNAHLQSKKHKENVTELKTKKAAPPPLKPKVSAEVKPKPILKGILKKDDPVGNVIKSSASGEVLPSDFFDNGTNETLNKDEPERVRHDIDETSHSEVLPSDFFDNESSADVKKDIEEKSNPRKRKASSTSEQLPEGFFDDPKQDAKARNVEFKDPQDEEWEKFQKMIQEETKISETIQDEEDEEAEMLKDMAELNNMRSCLTRVENLKNLVRKSHQSKSSKGNDIDTPENEGDDTSGDSDLDLDDLFDWRAKMA